MNNNNKYKENYIPFSLGIDDTDSSQGMCTTYLGTKLFLHLHRNPLIEIQELPFLIRLNPNTPFRTKGNGSVIIYGSIHVSAISWLQSTVSKYVMKFSQLDSETTNPGLLIWYGIISKELQEFGKKTLWDVIELPEIEEFISQKNVFAFHPKSKRGLVGCLAGIGLSSQMEDYTFELLQYRFPPYDPERHENAERVWQVDENKYNLFSCIDPINKSVKIFPKGLDPVFCGIRGDNPSDLLKYWEAIQPQPKMQLWMIFKSNQGTDAHLLYTPIHTFDHPKCVPYRVIVCSGFVVSKPSTEIGGHVYFEFTDKSKKIIKKCFAYEPTKEFRDHVLQLRVNDEVEISGNIRPSDKENNFDEVINLEKIKVIKLAEDKLFQNPLCPNCSKRMESAGKNQPFRCKKCKILVEKSQVETRLIERNLKENKVYLPAIDAQRHLTKPLKRQNKNKFDNLKEIYLLLEKIFTQSA